MTKDNNQKLKTVAFDSSMLGNLARNYFKETDCGVKSRKFVNDVYKRGYVPFLTTQHVAELIKHENDDIVETRIAFLESLPLISSIFFDGTRLGNVIDIHILECNAFLANEDASIFAVRDFVKKTILK